MTRHEPSGGTPAALAAGIFSIAGVLILLLGAAALAARSMGAAALMDPEWRERASSGRLILPVALVAAAGVAAVGGYVGARVRRTTWAVPSAGVGAVFAVAIAAASVAVYGKDGWATLAAAAVIVPSALAGGWCARRSSEPTG